MSSLAEIQWLPCPDVPPLAAPDIHVWAFNLAVAAEALEKLAATLSADEMARAKRFKFDQHRNRFIAGRAALRMILGRYLGVSAAALRFDYLENGKPAFAQDFAGAGIHFNLAHTEDLALAAVTRLGLIGVDVEAVRPIKDADALVERFFSARENAAFQKVPEGQKPAAFFNLWTRKEALLKATGEGITKSLSLVEVSFLPGEPARLVAISGDEQKAVEWSLRDPSPARGFAGAIAIQARDVRVSCWKWTA